MLVALSAASRERYETFHHPRLLARGLAGEKLLPPPRRVPDIEPMQVFLFEKYYLRPRSRNRSHFPPFPGDSSGRPAHRHTGDPGRGRALQ